MLKSILCHFILVERVQYLGYYIQTQVTTKLLMHFINDVGRKQTL